MITAAGLASTFRSVSVTATPLLAPVCGRIYSRSPGDQNLF